MAWALVLKRGLVNEDAEDAVSHLLVHWFQQCDRYKEGGPASVQTFAYTVMKRELVSLLRGKGTSQGRWERSMRSLDAPAGPGTEQTLGAVTADPREPFLDPERQELAGELKQFMRGLTEAQREAVLANSAHPSIAAAARSLGISRPALYERLDQVARAACRSNLRDYLS